MPATTKSSKPKVNTKLNVEGSEADAKERFCRLYNGRTTGKQALLGELVSAGTILKETGLMDIVLNLDENPEFRKAPNTAKTRMLLVELAQLFAGAVPQPEVRSEPEQCHAVEVAKSEPVAQPVAAKPEPVQKPPAKKVKLPDLSG